MNVGNVQILESNEIIPSNTFLSSRSTSIITNRLEIIEIVRITYSSGKMRCVINGRRKKRGGKKERKKEKRVGREKDEREISRGTWPCKTAQHSIRFKLAFTPRRGNNGGGFFFSFLSNNWMFINVSGVSRVRAPGAPVCSRLFCQRSGIIILMDGDIATISGRHLVFNAAKHSWNQRLTTKQDWRV